MNKNIQKDYYLYRDSTETEYWYCHKNNWAYINAYLNLDEPDSDSKFIFNIETKPKVNPSILLQEDKQLYIKATVHWSNDVERFKVIARYKTVYIVLDKDNKYFHYKINEVERDNTIDNLNFLKKSHK